MGKLSGGCGEDVWRACGSCLKWLGRLSAGYDGMSGGFGRLSGGCGKAVWRVWGDCIEGVGKLSGG